MCMPGFLARSGTSKGGHSLNGPRAPIAAGPSFVSASLDGRRLSQGPSHKRRKTTAVRSKPTVVLTSSKRADRRATQMSRPRQRFYPPDEPPPDVARQQRLELENAALRREVGTLKDVLR